MIHAIQVDDPPVQPLSAHTPTSPSSPLVTTPHITSPGGDRYEIPPEDVVEGSKIGVGGQAAVFKGTWHGVEVAVKVFGFGSNNKKVAKIQKEIDREIAALSALTHPHIVQLYGYFQEPTRTGLVVEYCDGGDLSDYCIDLPLPMKLVLGAQIAAALAYLHSRIPAVVHGDIKVSGVHCPCCYIAFIVCHCSLRMSLSSTVTPSWRTSL